MTHSWAEVMTRATLQGTLVILFVLVICLCFSKRLTHRSQCWLWRLAFLKLLLLSFVVTPIKLPVLPEATPREATVEVADLAQSPSETTALQTEFMRSAMKAMTSQDSNPPRRDPFQPDSQEQEMVNADHSPSSFASWSSILPIHPRQSLFVLWLMGVAGSSVWLLRSAWQAKKIRLSCRTLQDASIVESCERLVEQFGIQRMPKLETSPLIRSPLLIGTGDPAIVFPVDLINQLSDDQLDMVIAHELSHLKRRDLWWSWVPVLVQTLFFFHPLVWIARNRWLLTREMACDELVLSTTQKSAACYAEALLNVSTCMRGGRGSSQAGIAMGSTCMVQTSFSLKRRIQAMKDFTNFTSVSTRTAIAYALLGCIAVLPWQLVQRSAEAAVADPGTRLAVVDGENLDFEAGNLNGGPAGWGGGGVGYELTLHSNARTGQGCGQIEFVGTNAKRAMGGFGTFTSGFSAKPYYGKRLRYSGYLKSDMEAGAWAGLWMRVDGEFESIGFDNMKGRPVKGRTGWKEYSIVIDVPEEATNIVFGFLLSGEGKLWGDDLNFEVVGEIGEGPEVTDFYKEGKKAFYRQRAKKLANTSRPQNLGLEEVTSSGRFSGWFGGGKGFTVEFDSNNARSGEGCVRSERVDDRARFCGLSQRISAEPYHGKTIRLTGYIRTKNVTEGGSGLWMRIDGPNRNTLGFDNMNDRPILGTQDWAQYAIEMEVPVTSKYITFGYLLKGGGIAWADDYAIETIDSTLR